MSIGGRSFWNFDEGGDSVKDGLPIVVTLVSIGTSLRPRGTSDPEGGNPMSSRTFASELRGKYESLFDAEVEDWWNDVTCVTESCLIAPRVVDCEGSDRLLLGKPLGWLDSCMMLPGLGGSGFSIFRRRFRCCFRCASPLSSAGVFTDCSRWIVSPKPWLVASDPEISRSWEV